MENKRNPPYHFGYALYDSLPDEIGTRFDNLHEAQQEAEAHQIIVLEQSKILSNGCLLIIKERIAQAPDIWIPSQYEPQYDGRYLAHLVRKEVCGTFHEYQEVISNTFCKWEIAENVRLLNWKFIHYPKAEYKSLEEAFNSRQ